MMSSIRRHQRKMALLLLLLNVSGARSITVCDACEHHRTFFSAGLGFKTFTKKVMHVQRKKTTGNSFGERASRACACDLATVRRERFLAPVVTMPSVAVTLDLKRLGSIPAPPLGATALPGAHSPQLLI